MRGLVILLAAACAPGVHGPRPPPCAPGATCEAWRISGHLIVTPDIDTQVAMHDAHVRMLRITEQVCIGTDGNVLEVTPTRSSGFPGYDRDVAAQIREWKYRPFMVKGVPTKVCTMVTMLWKAH